jgi:hypothetical protein
MAKLPGHSPLRLTASITATLARIKLDPRQGVPELDDALSRTDPTSPWAVRVAGCALMVALKVLHRRDLAESAIELLSRSTEDRDSFAALLALAKWHLQSGDVDSARRIEKRLVKMVGTAGKLPWELAHLRAGLLPDQDVAGRWKMMQSGLASLERSVPEDGGLEYVAPWLSDKGDFQQDLLQAATSAVREGKAAPIDLVEVFEFLTGREIRPVARAEQPNRIAPGHRLEQLAGHLAGCPTKFFFFLEVAVCIARLSPVVIPVPFARRR